MLGGSDGLGPSDPPTPKTSLVAEIAVVEPLVRVVVRAAVATRVVVVGLEQRGVGQVALLIPVIIVRVVGAVVVAVRRVYLAPVAHGHGPVIVASRVGVLARVAVELIL